MPDQTLMTPPSSQSKPNPTSAPKGRSLVWLWVVLVVLFGIAALVYFRRRHPSEQTQADGGRGAGGAPAPVVSTTNSTQGNIGIYINALGTVTPLNTVSVKSRVDGQLIKVYYEEGQFVKAGDPLVDIDPAPFQAALEQAEGQLARDTAQLEDARLDLDRYTEAFARDAIPKQQLDTQRASVHQFEGTVKFDQGQVDNARTQLGYTHITAPISGRVGLRLVDAGNIVHATDTNPLVVITQLQPITVIFTVAEDYLGQIQKQMSQNKSMVVDAYDRTQQHKIATGRLETLDNQVDTSTGTVKLKAIFTNEDGALFPNQFVNARLLVDTLQDVTLVPNPVIQRDSQGAFVYLLNSDLTIATNPVVVKATDRDISAVDGLEPNATLVADNFNRLMDGMKVSLRKNNGEQQLEGGPKKTGARNGG